MDELAGFNKLPILSQALSELRKYSGCILAATQTTSQLYKIYGRDDTNTILAQFDTKFVFRNQDTDMNKHISEIVGRNRHRVTQESISYGAHEMRDGVNLAEIEKNDLIIEPSEIANLRALECFILTRDLEQNVTKIKMSFVG